MLKLVCVWNNLYEFNTVNISRMGLCEANHLNIDLETEVIHCEDYLHADAAHS